MTEFEEMIACREVVEIVTDYLEGALPAEQMAIVDRHLDHCDACTLYLDQMRATISGIGRLREEEVPGEMRTRLMAAFREMTGG